jgi:hypothetical protein
MPKTYEISNIRYIRKGQCNQCGWCCSHEDCEYLGWKEGRAYCKIHPSLTGGEDKRELKCKLFPEAPPILNEKCGYYFIDLWEDNKIVTRKL